MMTYDILQNQGGVTNNWKIRRYNINSNFCAQVQDFSNQLRRLQTFDEVKPIQYRL